MSPITHFLMGWVTANARPGLSLRDRALVTWASVIPDIDGLGIVPELLTRNSSHPLNWWTDYHHVLGHNIGFALVWTAILFWCGRHKWATALLGFASFHLHLLADLVGARGPDGDQWPIPYLSPFSTQWQWTWSGQWPLNAWQNVLITGLLLVISLVLARNRGYSPLGLFSTRGEAQLISVLRHRFSMSDTARE